MEDSFLSELAPQKRALLIDELFEDTLPERVGAVDRERPHARRRPLGSEARCPRKIRYTDAEWSLIVERARACCRAPARFVREVSLGSAPKPRHSQSNDALIREMGRIGNNLQLLVHVAKQSGTLPQAEALHRALSELIAAVRRLDGASR